MGILSILTSQWSLFLLLGLSIINLLVGFWLELSWIGLLLPCGLISTYLLLFHLRKVYLVLFFLIPWSMEMNLTSGIGIDFPGEIILVLLSGIAILFSITKPMRIELIKPLGVLMILSIAWNVVTMLMGDNLIVSGKWILAKLWYILPFYVLPFFLFDSKKHLHKLLDFYLIGLLLATSYFFLDHAMTGFDFMAKTSVGKPFWRNHVNYACTLVVALPIIYYRYRTHRIGTGMRYLTLGLIFLVFLYFSYARVAYLCIAAWVGYLFILHLRLTKVAIVLSLMGILYLGYRSVSNEQFIQMAPEYNQAITQQSFEKKLDATLEGRDISTMERLHRWVAGYRIAKEKPITGVGPANFYNSYKPYTLYAFETYVSDNPERSGIHNYYFMLLTEQGIPGLFLFTILIIVALLLVDKKYHLDSAQRNLLTLAGSILIMIIVMNTINDMIEVIKIGGWFFFSLFLTSSSFSREHLLLDN